MSDKPVAKRSSPRVLGIICILLVASVLGTYFFQSSIISTKNSTYDSYVASHTQDNTAFATLQTQYATLQSQFTSLQESYETYVSTHKYNDSDYGFLKSTHASLQSTYESLQSTYNSLQSTYNTYVSSHNHADSEYNSITSQLADANSQITTMQAWLNGNITALKNANNQITNATNQIANLQNQINTLNSQIGNLQTSLNGNLTALVNANSQINTLNNQINSLNTQISNLNAIATLQKSTVWLSNQAINVPANQPFAITYNFEANYAGYFTITAQTSSATSINYRVLINGQNLSYSNGLFGVAAGTSFTMYFPLTQLGNVQITLGSNTKAVDGLITITYYY